MMVRSVGLSKPLELSVFSVDTPRFVDSPVESGPSLNGIRTVLWMTANLVSAQLFGLSP